MDVIILAGGKTDPKDPLFPVTHGEYKALLEIAGKPMIQWILDALNPSDKIDQVVIVGLAPDVSLESSHLLKILPDEGDIIDNLRASAEALIEQGKDPSGHALLISADIPTITSGVVDWMVEAVNASDHDIYYSVIERSVMEARFPESRRTYVRFKDIEACGGDLNAVRLGEAVSEHELVHQLTAARKNAMKQALLIGVGTLILLLTRQLTLNQAVSRICKRLKLDGKAVINPYAEAGMDIDKPFQLEIVRKDLMTRHDG
jgi:GTP:adenosylcobinamide-phosphate guanylyltransferase